MRVRVVGGADHSKWGHLVAKIVNLQYVAAEFASYLTHSSNILHRWFASCMVGIFDSGQRHLTTIVVTVFQIFSVIVFCIYNHQKTMQIIYTGLPTVELAVHICR